MRRNSVIPPHTPASGWMMEAASFWTMSTKSQRVWWISPVAIGTSTALAMAALASISSGMVGSSTHARSKSSHCRMALMAEVASFHALLASVITSTSAPTAFRTAAMRAASSRALTRPTLIFTARRPVST